MADDAPPPDKFTPPPAEWGQRRAIIRLALGFIALWVSFIIIWPGDANTAVSRANVATQLIWTAGGIIATYVFGAAWDDKNAREALRR